jgi:glycosyltransferase involved in cell wall biosynthesis
MRALKTRGWNVRLWSLVGPAEPAGSVDAVRAFADEVVLFPRDVTARDRRSGVVRDLVTRRALHAHWFWSESSAQAAGRWLADADDEILLVEQLYMYPFVPARLRGRVALDSQNDETARMRAISRGDGSLGRRLIARAQVGPVEAFERAALRSVGRVLAVSDLESGSFERWAPGRVLLIPNGVDARAIVPISSPPASQELLFLGSLGYSANIDAVRHFSMDIAPHLAGSGATLTVVGSNPPPAVYQAAARSPVPVSVIGYAPDLRPHYVRSRAMIVPLRHGGGTRLKILEALAWGLPVVTTSLGAAGLGLVDGQHALIADEPSAFGTAVDRLLRDDDLWMDLSRSGRAFVEERYDWEQIASPFETAMRDLADGVQARH